MQDPIELTVIMPTYDRAAVVEKCLKAMADQTLSKRKFEIIVADDGSPLGLERVVNEAAGKTGLNIVYFRQANSGANTARNNAIGLSKGRILLFINDDTIPVPVMLEEHVRMHDVHPQESAAVLGQVTISPEVPHSLFARLHLDASYDKWKGRRSLDWKAFYTCNISAKKSFLSAHGLFEPSLRYHEDTELGERLSRHGLEVIYHPQALGHHFHRLEEADYLRVAELEGRALYSWHAKAPHLGAQLAEMGYYPVMGLRARLKYAVADAFMNPALLPFWLRMARFFSDRWENGSVLIYRKVFQALKRKAIRNSLAGAG